VKGKLYRYLCIESCTEGFTIRPMHGPNECADQVWAFSTLEEVWDFLVERLEEQDK
jgi:hypothetical protein